MTAGRTRALALVVGCVVAIGLGVASPSGARQQDVLVLERQSTYVAADGVFEVDLAWSGRVTPDLELGFVVYGVLGDEAGLDAPLGEVLNRSAPVPVSSLPVVEGGAVRARLPVRSFSPGDDERLLLPDSGVYPVAVEIRGEEGLVASLTTWLVRLPTEIAEADPLPVAAVLEVSSADGLELSEVTALLAEHPTVPVTVHLGSGVLSQLAGDPAATSALRAALGGRPVLAAPRFDVDPSALVGIGRADFYGEALEQTWAEIERFGLVAERRLVPLEIPLTAAGAEALLDLGITTVLSEAPGMASGVITTSSGRLAIVSADDDLSQELGGDQLAVLRAHRLIARLSLRAGLDRRPVLLGPATTSPSGMNVLLGSLDQLGFLGAWPLGPDVSRPLPVRPAERSLQDLDPVEATIAELLARLDTYGGFFLAGGTSPEALQDDILLALSRDLNPEARAQALDRIDGRIDEAFADVDLPGDQTVTLAAQQSVIPLAIHNGASGGRRVMLRFESDKVEVAADGTVVELAPGVNSVDLEIETRSLGVSPLEVQVLTPDGVQQLASSRFQVRSTAVPGLGLLLSGIAMGLLLAWWGRSVMTDRRARRLAPGTGSNAGPASGDATDTSAPAASVSVVREGSGTGPETGGR